MKEYKQKEDAYIKETELKNESQKTTIEEERQSFDKQKRDVEKCLQEIEDKVYVDTKEPHHEKFKLDEMIVDLDKDIEDLLRVLERKKKEKSLLELEMQVHEKKINEVRMIYGDQIDQFEGLNEKVSSKIQKNDEENEALKKSKSDLEAYTEAYNV